MSTFSYMLQNLSLFLFFLLSSFLSFGQSWEWVTSGGGIGSDKATTIVVDDAGYSYITGYYNEEATFGSTIFPFVNPSSKEVFVAKLDPLGNYVWAKYGTNFFDDRALGLCLDPNGNIYITGTCWGGLDFGSLSVYNSNAYTDQIFVLKLDNDGNEIWMRNAGNDDNSVSNGVNENGDPQTLYQDDHGQDIISDSEGNLYITGFLSNIDEFDVHYANFGSFSIPLEVRDSIAFLAKISNDGNWQWVSTFDGIWQHRDNALGIDDEDNVYVAGGFVGTNTFGTQTLTSNSNSEDIYVAKYDKNGNFLFVVSAGDSLDDRADAITYGYDGHMYVTGEFRSTVGFGTDSLNNNGEPTDRDVFVAKLSKDGNWIWATKGGSNKGKDRGTGITANQTGNVFVSGQFSGDARFNNIEVASNGDSVQVFVASIDTLGKWQWVMTGGSTDFDRGASVDCDENCNVYVTGYYSLTLTTDDGSHSVTSVGSKDIFTGKIMDACTGYSPPPPGEGPGPDIPFVGYGDPNVFTPNGDGINDELSFGTFENVEGEIVIVNRWGNVVFRTSNLNTTWDGKSPSDIPVSEGTYYYNIDMRFPDGTSDQKSGFVTVVK